MTVYDFSSVHVGERINRNMSFDALSAGYAN